MRRLPALPVLVSALVVLAGCGGSDAGEGADAVAATEQSTVTEAPVASAPAATEPGSSEPSATEPESSEPGGSEPAVTEPVAGLPDGVTSSGGEQPTFAWPAVDGVALYSVVVADSEGRAFWGWQGTELAATVGDGAPDPLVDPSMTWSVVALDADGAPLWDSGPLPV